jgi:hypothetical protein
MTNLITTLAVVGVIVGLLSIATWCVMDSLLSGSWQSMMDEEEEEPTNDHHE